MAVEVKKTLNQEQISTLGPLGKGFCRARLTPGGLGLGLMFMLWFLFILEDWTVAVGVEEPTEQGAQGHPRS